MFPKTFLSIAIALVLCKFVFLAIAESEKISLQSGPKVSINDIGMLFSANAPASFNSAFRTFMSKSVTGKYVESLGTFFTSDTFFLWRSEFICRIRSLLCARIDTEQSLQCAKSFPSLIFEFLHNQLEKFGSLSHKSLNLFKCFIFRICVLFDSLVVKFTEVKLEIGAAFPSVLEVDASDNSSPDSLLRLS